MNAVATRPAPLGVTQFADGLYAVASSRPGAAPYRVERVGAAYVCSCPAYTYRRDDGADCKHGAAIRASIAAAGPHCANRCDAPVAVAGMVCDDCRRMAATCAAQDGLTLVEWALRQAGDVAAAAWLGGEASPAPAPELAPSTPEEVAQSAAIVAEVVRELVAATPTSVAPISINRTRPLRNPMPATAAQPSATRAAMLARADAAHKADLASGNLWG